MPGHKSCGRSPYAELLLLDEALSKRRQGLFQGIGLYSTFEGGLIEQVCHRRSHPFLVWIIVAPMMNNVCGFIFLLFSAMDTVGTSYDG